MKCFFTCSLSWAISAVTILLFSSCEKDTLPSPTFGLVSLPASDTGIDFENRVVDGNGFDIVEYLYFYNGGGVSIGDINNDSLPDVFFTGNQTANKLYLNKGNLRFEDISTTAGVGGIGNWKTGATMADVNADGNLDIFVCGVGNYKNFNGRNQLLINNGDLTFADRTKEYGLDFSGFSTHASFFDFDNDGDLDMYLVNHSVHTPRSYGTVLLRNQSDRLAGDKLYRNEKIPGGTSRFTEVTSSAGIHNSQIGYGLAVSVADLNNDGLQDIYVSNDFHENDYVYINVGNGTFSQQLEKIIPHSTRFSMGSDIADVNNDGWNDIVTLDMQPESEEIIKTTAGEEPYDNFEFKLRFGYHYQFTRNALQVNKGVDQTGNLMFSDVASLAGVQATDWSWSALLADFDNDGLKDLFISNGIARRPNDLDYINYISSDSAQRHFSNAEFVSRMPEGTVPDYFFRNTGDLKFANMNGRWVEGRNDLSNGAAYSDLDNDGDLDLVVNHLNATASVYRNDLSDSSNYVKIRLRGSRMNLNGIGARILLFTDGLTQMRDQMLSRGWMSSVDPTIHFGVGDKKLIDSIIVIWPGGKYQALKNLQSNKTIELSEADAMSNWNYRQRPQHTLLQSGNAPFHAHHENYFLPFNNERLLPFSLSTPGPCISIADVNNDKLDDFYISGAKGQPGSLYLQQKGGTFHQNSERAFAADTTADGTASCFFDADLDGDKDLVVIFGGQEIKNGSNELLPRLYVNDGHGNFRKATDLLPEVKVNASCISATDIDSDGDIDLFIGGRVVPGKYGALPPSFLLLNDGKGKFNDVSERMPTTPGMVTDAQWHDLNSDGRPDLILAGEWMPVTVLIQGQDGTFSNRTSEYQLSNTSGLWNRMASSDFDRDGDIDFIIGNHGLNSRLKASPSEPIELFTGDIDGNGDNEQILTYYNGGKRAPFVSRDQLIKQVPALKKKFLRYADYRNVTVEAIIPQELISKFGHLKAEKLTSVYLQNEGGSFIVKDLPTEAQVAPVFALKIADLNGDGNPDILGGGNLYQVQPELGRYDASYGFVLLGDGKGNFETVPQEKSGFVVKGEMRDIKSYVNSQGKSVYLVGRNNDSLMIFNPQ